MSELPLDTDHEAFSQIKQFVEELYKLFPRAGTPLSFYVQLLKNDKLEVSQKENLIRNIVRGFSNWFDVSLNKTFLFQSKLDKLPKTPTSSIYYINGNVNSSDAYVEIGKFCHSLAKKEKAQTLSIIRKYLLTIYYILTKDESVATALKSEPSAEDKDVAELFEAVTETVSSDDASSFDMSNMTTAVGGLARLLNNDKIKGVMEKLKNKSPEEGKKMQQSLKKHLRSFLDQMMPDEE